MGTRGRTMKRPVAARQGDQGDLSQNSKQYNDPWEGIMPNETDGERSEAADLSRRNLFRQVGLAGVSVAISGATLPSPVSAQAPASSAASAPLPEALETL